MAGKVPYSETNETLHDQSVKSPSYSYEELPSASTREYIGDILPISRAWSKISEYPSESNSNNQLQEQYMFSVEQCLGELKRIRRNNGTMFIQVKKTIRDKVENMLKIVKQSFEHMHIDGTKQIEVKCETIGRVLSRIEVMLEEGSQENSTEIISFAGQGVQNNNNFLENIKKEKLRIESDVEAVILKLNKKRENDEQIFMDFKDDIQQQAENGILKIERSLESLSEQRVKAVEEKISELRKALANLQHLSKFS